MVSNGLKLMIGLKDAIVHEIFIWISSIRAGTTVFFKPFMHWLIKPQKIRLFTIDHSIASNGNSVSNKKKVTVSTNFLKSSTCSTLSSSKKELSQINLHYKIHRFHILAVSTKK